MQRFVCSECGYVYEGSEAPDKCPQCGATKEKFTAKAEGSVQWADQHKVGVAGGMVRHSEGCSTDILNNFKCSGAGGEDPEVSPTASTLDFSS